MPIDTDNLVKALLKKGFVEKNGNHKFYTFCVDGKKTSVFTKISHGSSYKQYGDPLIDKVKTQMGLTKGELNEFIDCKLTYEMYLKLLIDRNKIK